jgi:hypothetical protein
LLAKALEGGHHLTREELTHILERAGIACKDLRPTFLMMQAELDAVITSGPRRGKQFTYALLDERAPPRKTLARDEALAELARRYFASHGPAQVRDFAWWSGLTIADAKAGIAMAKLTNETVEGMKYFFAPLAKPRRSKGCTFHLLPNYDEYLVAYKDRGPSLDDVARRALGSPGDALANAVVRNGKIIGGWRRAGRKGGAVLEARLLVPSVPAERPALEEAIEHYGRFLGSPIRWSLKRARSK